jgi:hypothetical protein
LHTKKSKKKAVGGNLLPIIQQKLNNYNYDKSNQFACQRGKRAEVTGADARLQE